MGLFDKLKKTVAQTLESAENLDKGDAAEKVMSAGKDLFSKLGGMASAAAQNERSAPEAAPAPKPAADAYRATPAARKKAADLFPKFDDVITRRFADCEVRRNLPACELDPACHPACTPVQFLFYKNGAPSLAVVLVQQNTYRGMNVIGTKQICERLGIRYLRFFAEYDNEEEYVVERIRSAL